MATPTAPHPPASSRTGAICARVEPAHPREQSGDVGVGRERAGHKQHRGDHKELVAPPVRAGSYGCVAFAWVGRWQQEGDRDKAGEADAAQHDEGQPPAALLAEPRPEGHAYDHGERTAAYHPCYDLRPYPGREKPDGCYGKDRPEDGLGQSRGHPSTKQPPVVCGGRGGQVRQDEGGQQSTDEEPAGHAFGQVSQGSGGNHDHGRSTR